MTRIVRSIPIPILPALPTHIPPAASPPLLSSPLSSPPLPSLPLPSPHRSNNRAGDAGAAALAAGVAPLAALRELYLRYAAQPQG